MNPGHNFEINWLFKRFFHYNEKYIKILSVFKTQKLTYK